MLTATAEESPVLQNSLEAPQLEGPRRGFEEGAETGGSAPARAQQQLRFLPGSVPTGTRALSL